MKTLLNTSGYFFGPLDPALLENYCAQLLDWCTQAELRGTILVTHEGLNIVLSGQEDPLKQVEAQISDLVGQPILFKHSYSETHPFKKLSVKIKPEVITFGESITTTAPAVDPQTLKRWLDQGQDDAGKKVVLMDTRNDYEVALGSFEGAIDLKIETFRDFARTAKDLDPDFFADKTVVTFCTGGIRCEKAAPFLGNLQQKATVYQLEGGILNYFDHCGGAHWKGDCFVFDRRIVLSPGND